MPDLFAAHRQLQRDAAAPLALRLRPRTLAEFVGQEHFLGPGRLLRRMLDADRLSSMIFWGPPGSGKTALAEVIAGHTGRHFERANAAMIGVKEVRRVIDEAAARLETRGTRSILFLDEIHRFARNQQDVLLADVESGLITLIGASTENPWFAVNSALVSRSTVFQFQPLSEAVIAALLRRAVADERGFPHLAIEITGEAIAHWARACDGDARRALTALEIAVLSQTAACPALSPRAPAAAHAPPGRLTVTIDLRTAEESIQAKALQYDPTGDEHYDTISAFIKSMRGSDPDAAVYWLARMLEAGEDPRFIARRIAILASEDIGNADPLAIQVAASAWMIVERVGMPEAQLTLAHAATYMAMAEKSNAAAMAIWSASKDVKEKRTLPVPRHLRDAHYTGAAALGHGQNYAYPHSSADGYVAQEYLGVDRVYYRPTERGAEAQMMRRLEELRSRAAAAPPPDPAVGQADP